MPRTYCRVMENHFRKCIKRTSPGANDNGNRAAAASRTMNSGLIAGKKSQGFGTISKMNKGAARLSAIFVFARFFPHSVGLLLPARSRVFPTWPREIRF